MAILTRKEFAELCGVTPGYLNTYISRKKVVVLKSDKGKIETEEPLNVFFRKNLKLNNSKSKGSRRVNTSPAANIDNSELYNEVVEKIEEQQKIIQHLTKKATAEPTKEIVEKTIIVESGKKESDEEDEEANELYQWEVRKKIADTLKAEKQAEKEALAVEKLMGKLMPTEMVEQIIKINVSNIYKSLENEMINIGGIYCDILASGDRAKLGEIVKRIRESLQRIVTETEDIAFKEIENVINEYAETRNRGERK